MGIAKPIKEKLLDGLIEQFCKTGHKEFWVFMTPEFYKELIDEYNLYRLTTDRDKKFPVDDNIQLMAFNGYTLFIRIYDDLTEDFVIHTKGNKNENKDESASL